MKSTLLIISLACATIQFGICQMRAGLNGRLSASNAFEFVYLAQIKTPSDFFNNSEFIIIDSARIQSNGQFSFPDFEHLDTSIAYRISVVTPDESPGIVLRKHDRNNYLFVVNDGSPINIRADARRLNASYAITGSATNLCFKNIARSETPMFQLQASIADSIDAAMNDPAIMARVSDRYMASLLSIGTQQIIPYLDSMVFECQDPRALALILYTIDEFHSVTGEGNPDTIFTLLETNWPDHPYTVWWQKKLHERKYAIPLGSRLPLGDLRDPDGKAVSLSGAGKRLILVDFWTSWCGPCRNENRVTVLPLYRRFASKGFDVFGVSFDSSVESWKRAIEQDGITWTQGSDLLAQQSPTWKDCKIEKLPTTYLLNSNLEVIAKDLRGVVLEEFVEDYFK